MKQLIKQTLLATTIGLLANGYSSAAVKQSVTFESGGQTLVGDLYLPDDADANTKLRAIVVTGSWTSVKEQMSGEYAEQLADRGYAALAFDFSGWGESKGGLPFVEDPTVKTQEVIDAAAFLASLPNIDANSIGGLGICASAGYITDAASQSENIAAAALVAPWLHDAEIVGQVYGDFVEPLLSASENAKAKFKQTGEHTLLLAASDTDETAVMFQAAYYTDPNRGAIAAYDNQFNVMSWEPWLNYDAIKTAEVLTKPTLLVHSDAAAIPQGAIKFSETGGDNIQLTMLDNVTQFDFYDNPKAMQQAVELVDAHFAINL